MRVFIFVMAAVVFLIAAPAHASLVGALDNIPDGTRTVTTSYS